MCELGRSTESRSVLTVGDIVRTYGDAYRDSHRLCGEQDKALNAIASCRTADLGGHLYRCDYCGAEIPLYNSCDNRHCPTCQTISRLRWIEAREADLLPIPYFHVVFTLPHALNPLIQGNPAMLYTLLFHVAAETLKAFGRDPKHLGAELGIVMVLHTWGRNLEQHVHVHCIVTGGGLSPDGERWIPCKANPHSKKVFLFPVKALSKVFRGQFLDALQGAFDRGELHFAAGTAPLADPHRFAEFIATSRSKDWVVYAKRPFAGPEQVIRYLSAYTHRVAIGNGRLLSIDDGQVSFLYKDYADEGKEKPMALKADEFIRRFLLHILPRRFMRIRYYGFLWSRYRREKLARCRELLGASSPEPKKPESPVELLQRLAGIDIARCPICGKGHLHIAADLASTTRRPPTTGPPGPRP
ncbi:MAG: IS91 family transposase [bacterium]|nr:IS91 family transposase [bacterium]